MSSICVGRGQLFFLVPASAPEWDRFRVPDTIEGSGRVEGAAPGANRHERRKAKATRRVTTTTTRGIPST